MIDVEPLRDPSVAPDAPARVVSEYVLERFHRAFEEELPRLERVLRRGLDEIQAPPALRIEVLRSFLALADDLLRHLEIAESEIHPLLARDPRRAALLDALLERDGPGLRAAAARVADAALRLGSAKAVSARAFARGVPNLLREIEGFLCAERALVERCAEERATRERRADEGDAAAA